MGYGGLVMKMYQKLALVVWVVIFGFGIYGFFTREDTAIHKLKSWSSKSNYTVKQKHSDILSVPLEGNLGVFYNCLTTYVSDSYKGGHLPDTGNYWELIIKLDHNTDVNFTVNSTEVLSFIIIPRDLYGSAIDASNTYRVSCDIRLLNKPDSDMHCEDKVLGNKIRPVCTYRPRPQLPQDNSKG